MITFGKKSHNEYCMFVMHTKLYKDVSNTFGKLQHCTDSHSLQHSLFNTLTSTPSLRHRSLQHSHFNTPTSTLSLQHFHFNTLTSTHSLRHVHFNNLTTTHSLQHIHFFNSLIISTCSLLNKTVDFPAFTPYLYNK